MNKPQTHNLLTNMALFKEVAEQGSFTATAQALHMTPSSISKRMAKLEEELGVKLIERTTRTMRLTTTGEQFLSHCQNMLSEVNSAVAVAHQSQDELKGDVSISAPKAFARLVLQPMVMQFLQQYPDINVRIYGTDDPVDLLRENMDCHIEVGDNPSEYLVAKPFVSVRQVVCATPAYLAGKPSATTTTISMPSDLQHHSCLTLGETATDNQWQFIKADESKEQMTVSVQGRFVCNHSGMRLHGVLDNLGIGCFPDFVVANQLATGELVEVLPDWQLQSKYHGMTWITYLPNRFQPLRLRTFIGFLLDKT